MKKNKVKLSKFQYMKIKQAKARLNYLFKNEPDFKKEFETLLDKWGVKFE